MFNFIEKINQIRFRKALNGKNIHVMSGTIISKDSEIGDYSYIGYRCFITKSKIGRYCSIANNVSIGMGEHDLKGLSTSSLFYENSYEKLTENPCVIGHDVWIGVDSIIRRGVKIGNGAIIGANSFVNEDIPSFAIAVGNPAKVIKYRFDQTQISKIEKSLWWTKPLPEAKKTLSELKN